MRLFILCLCFFGIFREKFKPPYSPALARRPIKPSTYSRPGDLLNRLPLAFSFWEKTTKITFDEQIFLECLKTNWKRSNKTWSPVIIIHKIRENLKLSRCISRWNFFDFNIFGGLGVWHAGFFFRVLIKYLSCLHRLKNFKTSLKLLQRSKKVAQGRFMHLTTSIAA